MADADDGPTPQDAARHVAAGRYAKASNLYERLIRGDPARAEFRYQLAEVYARRRRWDQAVVQYQAALRHAFSEPRRVHLGLGNAYHALGRVDEALAALEKATDGAPGFPDAHDATGQVYRARERPDDALREYDRAIAADPRFVAASLHSAEVLRKKRDDDGAISRLVDALALQPADREIHGALAALLPGREPTIDRINEIVARETGPAPHQAWGETLLHLGRSDSARKELLIAIGLGAGLGPAADGNVFALLEEALPANPTPDDLAPISRVLDEKDDADARARWATALLSRPGRAGHAIAQLELALRQAPAHEASMAILPRAFDAEDVSAEMRDDAIARLGSIVSASGSAPAHARWWRVLYSGGRRAAADESLIRALDLVSDSARPADLETLLATLKEVSPRPLEGLFLRVLQEGSLRSILRTLEAHFEKLGPIVDRFTDVRLMCQWALMLARAERAADAVTYLERAVARDPAAEIATAFGLVASSPKRQDLEPRLIALLEKATAAPAHEAWARAMLQAERNDAALAALRRWAELDPDNEEPWRLAGETYDTLKDVGRAIECFEKAVEANPGARAPYVAWTNALGTFEREEGAPARLARALSGPAVPAPAMVPWEGIEGLCAQTATRVSRLVEALERNGDEADASTCMDCGVAVFGLGSYEHARRLFDRAARFDPTDYFAQYDVALTLALLGDNPGAIERFTKSLELKPDSLDSYTSRARAYAALRQHAEASAAFAEALEKGTDPDEHTARGRSARAECFNYWANTLDAAGDQESALAKARLAVALQPDDYWSRFRVAYVLANLALPEQAITAYERTVAIDAENPYAHHNMADLWTKQGRARVARTKWEEVRGLYQRKLPDAVRGRDADYCVGYADICRDVFADYAAADVLLRCARILAPASIAVHTALVRLCLERQRWLDRRPRGADSWDSNLGDTRTRLRVQAHDTYLAAVRLLNRRPIRDKAGTRDAATLLELSELHLLVDDLDKAEATLKQAAAVDESSEAAGRMLGEVSLGMARYGDAIQRFRLALRRMPDDLHLRSMLGRALLKSGALDEAERTFQETLDIARTHVESLLGLGEVYLDMADKQGGERDGPVREELYTRAIDTLVHAIDVAQSPDRPIGMHEPPASAYYLRGYARVKLWETRRRGWDRGLLREALRDFRACLQLDPHHLKAAQAAQRAADAPAGGRSSIERVVPPLIVALAMTVFFVAQVGFFVGLPTWPKAVTLTADSLASLRASGVGPEVISALRPLEDRRFRTDDALLAHAKSRLDDKQFERVKSTLAAQAAPVELPRELVRLDATPYGLLTFGALIFLVAGAYLPQLTSLKFAGLQLDKSTADRVEVVYSLGISREEGRGRGRLGGSG